MRLRESFTALTKDEQARRFLENYFFLKSNFEPTSPGWKFWQYFRKDQVSNVAADFVFEGQNDLVVDTASMASLTDDIADGAFAAAHIEDFGTNDVVHHLNYFQQPRTIALIERALRLA